MITQVNFILISIPAPIPDTIKAMVGRDSIFSAFRMGPVVSGRGLISTEYYSELLNNVSEN